MTDHPDVPQPADEVPQQEAPAVELTGHEAVDGVLRSLDDLTDRPLAEHVAIFESAHETLRATLAEAQSRPSGPAHA